MINTNTSLSTRYLLLISIFGSLIYTGCRVYPTLVSQKPAHINRMWSIYKADNAGTAYSAIDQLNLANVSQLQVAWTHKFNDAPEGSRGANSESNPIIIDGLMYTMSARHRVY